ncbi:hypothetical protein [Clostridium perfringens]|uniref:hypothetical protein n=1 Tax=Clostridium perfringens TaxID=1502 RepID=UPI001A208D6D|nr:hypothetical protein [Clostridium perfringens]MCX0408567.1 hypothetical protein [Clostridium perfringens]HAT4331380.1 hypothetical protein [Clostridium perfringens]
MVRKSFTTTIDEEIQNKFREKCKYNEEKMNDVLEAFMNEYIADKYRLKISYTLQQKK